MILSSAMQVLLKFLWYFLSRLIIWGAAVCFVFLAFFMAMDYMDASVLTKDGLQVRAQVILKRSDPTTLSKVFSKGFLENDEALKSSPYLQYQVSGFDYSADTGFALIFPWQDTVTLVVSEKVANIKAQPAPGADPALSETPPKWKNAEYDVQLVRYEDSWRIVSMKLVKVLPDPTPTPVLLPSASILPSDLGT